MLKVGDYIIINDDKIVYEIISTRGSNNVVLKIVYPKVLSEFFTVSLLNDTVNILGNPKENKLLEALYGSRVQTGDNNTTSRSIWDDILLPHNTKH